MPFCFLCGAYRCSVCEDLICRAMLPFERRESDDYIFPVYSLFDWDQKNDKPLRHLLTRLKGGEQLKIFQRFALEFLKFGPFARQDTILIPAPAIRIDHAFTFAHTLATLTGLPIWPLLEKDTRAPQKNRNRQDRMRLQFTINPYSFEKFKNEDASVIFVDDVITSGATAQAAFVALGKPDKFEVWTIARRSLL